MLVYQRVYDSKSLMSGLAPSAGPAAVGRGSGASAWRGGRPTARRRARPRRSTCWWRGSWRCLGVAPWRRKPWNAAGWMMKMISGWWLTHPSEKYESQWEGLSHNGKSKMFETTNYESGMTYEIVQWWGYPRSCWGSLTLCRSLKHWSCFLSTKQYPLKRWFNLWRPIH